MHGTERARTDLRAELASTARGPLAFTLAAAAPDVWKRDDHMESATMDIADGMLVLPTCLRHDMDALDLCGSLASRHPTLTFDGIFEGEAASPGFTASSHRDGVMGYRVDFDFPFVARLGGGRPGEPGRRLAFYPKNPERDAAAPDHIAPWVGPLLAIPPVAGEWRRAGNHPACACYLRRRDVGDVTALVLEPLAGEGHVLSGVDAYGGYRAPETLAFDDLVRMFPELSGKLARTSMAARMEQEAAVPVRRPDDAGALPF